MITKNTWQKRQNSYLDVLLTSLPILQAKGKKRNGSYAEEDDISRELYLAIQKVIFSPRFRKKKLDLPTFQSNIQPNPKNKVKVKSEDKRPDFLWSHIDYVNRKRLDFHIECKRLRPDKTYHCREYVMSGILRFITEEWSYGVDCENGLMIGYIENLTIDECIQKISEYLAANDIPAMSLRNTNNKCLSKYLHTLDRNSINRPPIALHHYLAVI